MSHHLHPVRFTNEVVPLGTRDLELRNLVNFLLPWRLQIGGMARTDLRQAAKMLRLTATMCDDYADRVT